MFAKAIRDRKREVAEDAERERVEKESIARDALKKVAAIEAMGYRWDVRLDSNRGLVCGWVKDTRHDAAEADANNEAWRKSDGE